jgi:chemotaxis response regulator CheB
VRLNQGNINFPHKQKTGVAPLPEISLWIRFFIPGLLTTLTWFCPLKTFLPSILISIARLLSFPMKSISTNKIADAKPLPFPIVAIGASTGGADSFKEMLLHLPVNTGMSYIYIQHPGADGDGNLVEDFRRSSKLMVQEAKESTRLLPNQVYVVPPAVT